MIDLPPAVASVVPELYRDARIVDYAGVAATAWILHDIVITFADEVEYVWSTPWSVPKVCFLLSRYGAALAIPSISFGATKWTALRDDTAFDRNLCISVAFYKAIAGMLLEMSVEIVMLLRVNALYGNNRRIFIFFGDGVHH